MIEKDFTWVNTHKQIVKYLETKENAQIELIDLLKSVGIEPFNDKISPEGHNILLEEIDPFTFFCYIYKYGSQKRLELLQAIASKLMIDIPSDEKGLPSAQPQKVWLFPYKYARNNNEVPRLWSFFRKAINKTITDLDFQDILTIKSVGKTKLTEALFYIMPDMYLPINGPTKPYIEEKLNIIPKFNTYTEYISLLNQIRSKTNIPFYELSYQAWEWKKDKNNNMVNSLKYSDQLRTFLAQANTKDLKTKHYIKSYYGTNVKVSFGIGGVAEIPWISFLKEPFTTSNGIYPVYLYYKGLNLLILAYGISETKIPNESWNIQNPKTISEYFKENNLGKPKRYGSSFIYKVYDVNSLPNEEILDHDLNQLIEFYLNIKVQKNNEVREFPIFDSLTFIESLNNSGLIFNPILIKRFISSLITKPFVILTGLSGSGKTKLAQIFTKWICENETMYKIIPVGADWTNREPLLGYPNALQCGEYVKPESEVLNLILEAGKAENQNKPYFLILDEMNLSHVERYFADFLSAMESGESIPLHSPDHWLDDVPSQLKLPKNLFIVGTVNIDETTYMFSPKVLDRANVIEFRVSESEIDQYLKNIKPLNLEVINGQGKDMAASFVKLANDKSLKPLDSDNLNTTLIDFFKELKKTGAEFGYRSAAEIHRFVAVANQMDPTWQMDEIIDCAIMQKLLPKLHGSRKKLVDILKTLGQLSLADGKKIEEIFDRKMELDLNAITISKYPISLEKIDRMYKKVIENGFTSYAEA